MNSTEKGSIDEEIYFLIKKIANISYYAIWIAIGSVILSIATNVISISTHITLKNEIRAINKRVIWMNDRFVYRQNFFAIDNYLDNVIKPISVRKGLSATSCLHLTPKGEEVLEELGITDRLDRIFLDKKGADFEYVYLIVLQDDFIQRQLEEYSKKHKDTPGNLNPEDLPAILGAIYAYCLNR